MLHICNRWALVHLPLTFSSLEKCAKETFFMTNVNLIISHAYAQWSLISCTFVSFFLFLFCVVLSTLLIKVPPLVLPVQHCMQMQYNGQGIPAHAFSQRMMPLVHLEQKERLLMLHSFAKIFRLEG